MPTFYIKNQGHYPATYSFEDEAIDEESPTDWTNNDGTDCTSKIIEQLDGHIKIIQMDDNNGAIWTCQLQHEGDARTYGAIEFWMRMDDCTNDGAYFRYGDNTPTMKLGIAIAGDQWFRYNGAWNVVAAGVPADDTWYHISVRFDRTADTGGYGLNNQWEFRIDDANTYGPYAIVAGGTLTTIVLETFTAGTSLIYWDAIGYDWDTGYSMLDNFTLTHTDITSSVDEFMIDHKIKDFPRARAKIFGQTLEYDDIILVTGNYNSYHNAYKVQCGEYYKESMAMKDDTLGAAPANADHGTWTDNSVGSTDAYIIDKYNEHAYVVQLEDYDAGNNAILDFAFTSGVADGSIEFWVAITDPTLMFNMQVLDEAAGLAAGFRIDDDKFYYYDDNAAWTDFADTNPLVGKWYRVTITFDCSDDSLSYTVVDKDDVSIASQLGLTMNNTPTTIDDLRFATQDADSDYLVFIGAIGFTWDSDYTLGDNANLETTLADQTIFEGRVIKQNEEYIQDIELEALSVEVEEIMPGEEGTPYTPDGYSDQTTNLTEEVIAETINDNCNNITATLTDDIYRGTLTFENDTDEAIPFGFVEQSVAPSTATVETTLLDGHINYLQLSDGSNATLGNIYYYFEAQDSDYIEGYMASSDITKGGSIALYDGTTLISYILNIDNSQVRAYNGDHAAGGAWVNLVVPVNDTWIHFKIVIEATTGALEGLGQYEFKLWIDGTEYDNGAANFGFSNDQASFNNICFTSNQADTGYSVYFDAIGLSWDDHYTIGDNEHIYIEKVKVGAQTIDYSSDADHQTLQGEVSIKRIFNGIADLETYIWTVTPDHKFILSDGTEDSQIDFAALECWGETGTDIIERYNKVITKGGFSGGSRVYGGDGDADAQDTYGVKLVVRYYSSISDTELDIIATNILNMEDNTPKFVDLSYRNTDVGYLQPGETVTIPASTFVYDKNNTYIDSGEWIVSEVRYDALRDVSRLTLVNALFFEYDWYLTQEMESLINQ